MYLNISVTENIKIFFFQNPKTENVHTYYQKPHKIIKKLLVTTESSSTINELTTGDE